MLIKAYYGVFLYFCTGKAATVSKEGVHEWLKRNSGDSQIL